MTTAQNNTSTYNSRPNCTNWRSSNSTAYCTTSSSSNKPFECSLISGYIACIITYIVERPDRCRTPHICKWQCRPLCLFHLLIRHTTACRLCVSSKAKDRSACGVMSGVDSTDKLWLNGWSCFAIITGSAKAGADATATLMVGARIENFFIKFVVFSLWKAISPKTDSNNYC